MARDGDGDGRRRDARAVTSRAGRSGDPVVRALILATAVLAAAAATVVALSDDGRWMRIGVIAALWSTLLAVVALARRSAGPDADEAVAAAEDAAAAEADALRHTYSLELQAEIDARREHELTVEQEVRRRIAAERGEEIAGLRSEVERLRSVLEGAGTREVGIPRGRLQIVGGTAAPAAGSSGVAPPGTVPAPSGPPTGPPAPVTPLYPHPPPPAPAPRSTIERPAAAGLPTEWSASERPVTDRGGGSGPLPTWSGPPAAPAPPPPGSPSRTGGRTVAELLAAHAAESDRHRRGL